MKNLLIITLALFTINSFGQDYSLNDFTLDSLPLGDKLYEANHSKDNWLIEKVGERIIIEKDLYKRTEAPELPFSSKKIASTLNKRSTVKHIHKVKDGYLLGYNSGEFGGGLYFISNNGEHGYAIEQSQRIRQFISFNNKIFALEGLAHLGTSQGCLLELKKEGKWVISKKITLPDSPDYGIQHKDELLIVSSEHVVSFNRKEELNTVLKAPFYWGMLYPSSAIIDDNSLYIAMRKGILKISDFSQSPTYKWYVKKGSNSTH
ncbi:hypothetical protein FUAX_32800 [Fulvitalea axinellae]|uniref:Uncharacterized protein n=1 Tax=Fulvitalea axinellae TaxID=1182444 RepID=A0AAU9CRW3_9BACT|nr:hypothetical protein FUAX_32800 [Fulvitalea axinellae]